MNLSDDNMIMVATALRTLAEVYKSDAYQLYQSGKRGDAQFTEGKQVIAERLARAFTVAWRVTIEPLREREQGEGA